MEDYRHITDEAKAMWEVGYLSTGEIGKLFGVSRGAVARWLRRNGVDPAKGRVFEIECLACGKKVKVFRRVFRAGKRRYCSRDCYYRKVADGKKLVEDRTGLRQGRAEVAFFYPKMAADMVVHHEDRDQGNNHLSNLKLFKDSAEHLRYHRLPEEERPKPLWDGSVRFGPKPKMEEVEFEGF